MNYYKISWGYPRGAAEVGRQLGVLGISRDRLEIRLEGNREPVILKDDEVVSIRSEGVALLRNQVIIVDHTAYNTIGNVIFLPLELSIQQLLQQIHILGFKPAAKPVLEWNPAWETPEANDAQQGGPAYPPQGVGSADPRRSMKRDDK